MHQHAQATRQTVADLAQGVGTGQLAEQHRDQLRWATEPLRRPLGVVLLHQCRKFQLRKMLQKLTKQTHCLYHRFALLFGIRQPNSSLKKVVGAGSSIGGLHFIHFKAVWTRVT
jgi:hypothetical protein